MTFYKRFAAVFVLFSISLAFAQLSCGFVVDLEAPHVDSLYPAPGSTTGTSVHFGVNVSDAGAGVWLNATQSRADWAFAGCPGGPVATYLRWRVNSGAFTDTLWGATEVTRMFDAGDTVTACLHVIDSIRNLGCSCCPNYRDTCWSFVIFSCDSFLLSELCPSTSGIITSCDDQQLRLALNPVGTPLSFVDSAGIVAEVFVDGVATRSGTLGSQPWFSYHGNPGDATYPDTLIIDAPPTGYSHGDTVRIIVYKTDCPVVVRDTFTFIVDLEPPLLATYSPTFGDTVSPGVAISGTLFDNLAGLDSAWMQVRIYNSGSLITDTTYAPISASFSRTRALIDGDSVVVCVSALDSVFAQTGCTCPANRSDSCFWFIVRSSEPYAWVTIPFDSNGNGQIVSSCHSAIDPECGNQQIIVRAYDHNGMTETGIILRVDGVRYTDASPEIDTRLLGGDTLEVTFTPISCFTSGDIITFSLDTAYNALGVNIIAPAVGSFIVDLEPPVFSGLTPTPSLTINDTFATIALAVDDLICGDAIISDVHVRGIISGAVADYSFPAESVGTGDFAYLLNDLQNGDSIYACALAQDTCSDYCAPNFDSTCWFFRVVIGTVSATVIQPVDVNGDGRVISNCNPQVIIWNLSYDDAIGLDWAALTVEINGLTYNLASPELDTTGSHTLAFTVPSSMGDTIDFRISLMADLSGTVVTDIGIGHVVLDYYPPYRVSENPVAGSDVGSSFSITATFADTFCYFTPSAAFVDSVHITTSVSGQNIWVDNFPTPISGLVSGDVVTVCAVVSDKCRDYCAANIDTSCWDYNYFSCGLEVFACDDAIICPGDTVALGAVPLHYGGVAPYNIEWRTSTGLLVSTEENPPVSPSSTTYYIVTVTDDSGCVAVDTTIVFADFEPITIAELLAPPADAELPAGTDSLFWHPLNGTPPIFYDVYFDGVRVATAITDTFWEFAVDCGEDHFWGITAYNLCSSSIPHCDSVGVEFLESDTTTFATDSTVGPGGWVGDPPFHTVPCVLGARVTMPVDRTSDGRVISACDDQQIRFVLTTESGVDSSTIRIDVCGTIYIWGSPELTARGDTLVFTPTASWAHGTTCHFCVTFSDSTGSALDPAVCGDMIIDLEGPVFSGELPASGSTIFTDGTEISINALDDLCGSTGTVFDSLVIHTSMGFDSVARGTLTIPLLEGLENGEVVTVTAYSHDNCHDYCAPNEESFTWSFTVALGAVNATALYPRDINGDGCIETSCDCQPIGWRIVSPHWFDTSTATVMLDGTNYDWSSGALSITRIDSITAELVFDPEPAGVCLTECGEHTYSITYLADTLGFDSLSTDVGGIFDYLPIPFAFEFSPEPPDTPWCEDTLEIHISNIRPSCGSYCTVPMSFDVHVNSTLLTSRDFSGDTLLRIPVLSGDIVEIEANGYVDHDYICDSLNFSLSGEYEIRCGCGVTARTGPNQHSCPSTDVILGCDPAYSAGGILPGTVHFNWWITGQPVFSTIANPTVSPTVTTNYNLEVWAICVAGDTVRDTAQVTITIDHIPVSTPIVISPASGSTLVSGTHDLIWNTVSGSATVYYDVLRDDIAVAESLTDTTLSFAIDCEQTADFKVIAYNSCHYDFDGICNSAMNISDWMPADYETSLVVSIVGEPCGRPTAIFVYPPESTITACEDQQVHITLRDASGVALVPSSLRLSIEGTRYDTTASFISYSAIRPDSAAVTVSPPTGTWQDATSIDIIVDSLDNVLDVHLSSPVHFVFITDFEPPAAVMTSPMPDTAVGTNVPNVTIELSDMISGVNHDSIRVHVFTHVQDTLLTGIFTSNTVSLNFAQLGFYLAEGETAYIELSVCDNVVEEFCGANCTTYTWFLYYPYNPGCLRVPNPFTPNGDGRNDLCHFTFPDMGREEGELLLFDAHGVKIREVIVPAGLPVAELKARAIWDGKDDNGNYLPQGVYLYIIRVDGELVCDGTVTIAR